jgi:hypothetical protein
LLAGRVCLHILKLLKVVTVLIFIASKMIASRMLKLVLAVLLDVSCHLLDILLAWLHDVLLQVINIAFVVEEGVHLKISR